MQQTQPGQQQFIYVPVEQAQHHCNCASNMQGPQATQIYPQYPTSQDGTHSCTMPSSGAECGSLHPACAMAHPSIHRMSCPPGAPQFHTQPNQMQVPGCQSQMLASYPAHQSEWYPERQSRINPCNTACPMNVSTPGGGSPGGAVHNAPQTMQMSLSPQQLFGAQVPDNHMSQPGSLCVRPMQSTQWNPSTQAPVMLAPTSGQNQMMQQCNVCTHSAGSTLQPEPKTSQQVSPDAF